MAKTGPREIYQIACDRLAHSTKTALAAGHSTVPPITGPSQCPEWASVGRSSGQVAPLADVGVAAKQTLRVSVLFSVECGRSRAGSPHALLQLTNVARQDSQSGAQRSRHLGGILEACGDRGFPGGASRFQLRATDLRSRLWDFLPDAPLTPTFDGARITIGTVNRNAAVPAESS